jgi:hypothetical protein
MPPELASYFEAERYAGFLLIALATASIGFAAFLWIHRSAFIAMAWPLVIVGVFQLGIGLTVALRTPQQVNQLEQGLQTSTTLTSAAELARMDRVNANFRIVKATEAVLIVLGLFLALYFAHPSTPAAVGLGLLVEATVLLVFDAFAHERAHVYTEWLRGLSG